VAPSVRRRTGALTRPSARRKRWEVAKLSGVEGDWAHGFNSGCLASFRLALELIDKLHEEGADEARLAEVIESTLRDFPETDS
jgi:hypothetical protein